MLRTQTFRDHSPLSPLVWNKPSLSKTSKCCFVLPSAIQPRFSVTLPGGRKRNGDLLCKGHRFQFAGQKGFWRHRVVMPTHAVSGVLNTTDLNHLKMVKTVNCVLFSIIPIFLIEKKEEGRKWNLYKPVMKSSRNVVNSKLENFLDYKDSKYCRFCFPYSISHNSSVTVARKQL